MLLKVVGGKTVFNQLSAAQLLNSKAKPSQNIINVFIQPATNCSKSLYCSECCMLQMYFPTFKTRCMLFIWTWKPTLLWSRWRRSITTHFIISRPSWVHGLSRSKTWFDILRQKLDVRLLLCPLVIWKLNFSLMDCISRFTDSFGNKGRVSYETVWKRPAG